MKFSFIKKWMVLATVFCVLSGAFAQETAWKDIALPEIKSVKVSANGPKLVRVDFKMDTSKTGADKGEVVMISETGTSSSKKVGKTRRADKSVEFEMSDSGTYTFKVTAFKTNESEMHVSAPYTFKYEFPLEKPVFSLLNLGGGRLSVKWNEIHEAENYEIIWMDEAGGKKTANSGLKTEYIIEDLKPESFYDISVVAVRGNEKSSGAAQHKKIFAEKEREWTFTWFGQSSSGDRNKIEILDTNDLKFSLKSCTFNEKSGGIKDKGGKFTNYHDGISYYYTVINPDTENFELSADVHVDYTNPTPDGQEGFGIIAMDSLGENGVNSVNHYTNSAGILTWKFTTHIDGVKKEIKDGMGARFVSNITPEVIAQGDEGIAENGIVFARAFNYDNANLVTTGSDYRITLKKTNTGYHAVYVPADVGEGIPTEYIMYGPDKLRQLDKDHVYLGFAVARGMNATFSNIEFKVTDPKKDAPAVEEPPEPVPLKTVVDCPTVYYKNAYPFVYNSNSDGTLTIVTSKGQKLIDGEKVKADVDFKKVIKMPGPINDLIITFTPDEKFRPGPRQVIAQYNRQTGFYEESYKPVVYYATVIIRSFKGSEIYASPKGSVFGDGSKEKPVDLLTAVNYVKPGQTVVLEPGRYYIENSKGLIIERGNSGLSAKKRKTLTVEGDGQAIFDFSTSKGGMQIWGDWWKIEKIQVCNTGDNIKGIQVAGSWNILNLVEACYNGDTGIQISGQSTDPFEKWPHDNLILNCTSYGNCDPAQNNADGFAAKLTCGNGNVFRGCISYCNIDDGWDLFAKIESGPIGAVIVEDCIAYENGHRMDGTGNGDGNGFKMGGDGIAVPHVLRNSISFKNGMSGITSNSNPALILEKVTSTANGSFNITLYGKGKGEPRQFKASGVLSVNGSTSDNFAEMPALASDNNFFCNGSNGINGSGVELKADNVFVSTDVKNIVPGRKADGSIDMKNLFKLTDNVPEGVGARLD